MYLGQDFYRSLSEAYTNQVINFTEDACACGGDCDDCKKKKKNKKKVKGLMTQPVAMTSGGEEETDSSDASGGMSEGAVIDEHCGCDEEEETSPTKMSFERFRRSKKDADAKVAKRDLNRKAKKLAQEQAIAYAEELQRAEAERLDEEIRQLVRAEIEQELREEAAAEAFVESVEPKCLALLDVLSIEEATKVFIQLADDAGFEVSISEAFDYIVELSDWSKHPDAAGNPEMQAKLRKRQQEKEQRERQQKASQPPAPSTSTKPQAQKQLPTSSITTQTPSKPSKPSTLSKVAKPSQPKPEVKKAEPSKPEVKKAEPSKPSSSAPVSAPEPGKETFTAADGTKKERVKCGPGQKRDQRTGRCVNSDSLVKKAAQHLTKTAGKVASSPSTKMNSGSSVGHDTGGSIKGTNSGIL